MGNGQYKLCNMPFQPIIYISRTIFTGRVRGPTMDTGRTDESAKHPRKPATGPARAMRCGTSAASTKRSSATIARSSWSQKITGCGSPAAGRFRRIRATRRRWQASKKRLPSTPGTFWPGPGRPGRSGAWEKRRRPRSASRAITGSPGSDGRAPKSISATTNIPGAIAWRYATGWP